MSRLFKLLVVAGALAAPMAGIASNAQSQTSDYFKDKVVTFVVPHSNSGRGYSAYAAATAPVIAKELGASEVRLDFRPGAGGIVGSNQVWSSPPDGLTFALSSGSSLMLADLSDSEGVSFDATKFTYLGRATADDRVLTVGANSPLKSIQDVIDLDRPFVVPSQGADEDFYSMAITAYALGFEVKYVTGYGADTEATLAVVKGDGDGHMNSWPTSIPIIEAGDKRPILTMGFERRPDYPDVPTALEVVSDPEKKKILETLINIQGLHRSYFGPPAMPDDIATELRGAISRALQDPGVQKAMADLGQPVRAIDGAEQQKIVEGIYTNSGNIVPIMKEALASIQ